jgi:hypothetical protein
MANSVKSNLQRSPTSAAYMKGWLMKQTHGICKSFQKRYFILYNEELRYYKNQVWTISIDFCFHINLLIE